MASERAGLLYLCSSFGAASDQTTVAASATAAVGRLHLGPPAAPAGSVQWGGRWVAYDLPLITACGIKPNVRLFNWLLRSLARPSSTTSQQGMRRHSSRTSNGYDTVFVGSLSEQTDTAALQDAFSRRIGPVSNAAVVTNSDGVSKGFGFVSFQNSKLAARAVRHGLGERLHGKHVAVRPSKDGMWHGRAGQSQAQDHQSKTMASSTLAPLPQHASTSLHADATTGLSVLQAMHAVGVSPDRQTFHNVLELCAAVAKSSTKRADRFPAAASMPHAESDSNIFASVEQTNQETLAVSEAIVDSHMAAESLAPDEETVALQLRVCASCTPPALSAAVALLEPNELQRKGVKLTTKLLNGLLAVYCRTGDIATTFEMFNTRYGHKPMESETPEADHHSQDCDRGRVGSGLQHKPALRKTAEIRPRPRPSRGTYNILISACARAVKIPPSTESEFNSASLLQLAFDAYTQMTQQGIAPDHITLTSLLHACAKHAPTDEHRVVFSGDQVDEERQHTERVIALFEASVSDVTQKRERAALARVGLHGAATPNVEPNVAVFSALIGAVAPRHLPEEVAFILGQAQTSKVALNSFVLLNLARRLQKVRVDPMQFTLETRPEVLEAARCALRYAERHGVAAQPKGKTVMQLLKRLSTPTKRQPVAAPANRTRVGTSDA